MYDFVAQLVEHFPFKEGVLSSNLSKITFKSFFFLTFCCCSSKEDNRVQLSQGVFGNKENLNCEYLDNTLGKEIDKKIQNWQQTAQGIK